MGRGDKLSFFQGNLLPVSIAGELRVCAAEIITELPPSQVDKHNTTVSFVSIWTTGANLQADAALYTKKMRLSKELENIKSHLQYHCNINCLLTRKKTDRNTKEAGSMQ
jgi:hypothetical protein